MRRKIATKGITAFAACTLAISACNNSGSGGDDGAAVEPLSIHANSADTYQRNFNPYSPSVLHGAIGFIYEPLIIHTPMKPDESTPWLAEEMEFNEDGTSATFALREGVQWSDGEPFSADDVVFTFTMMQEHPATNSAALDIEDATVLDEYTAEITFSEPQFAYEQAIGNTIIVPEHIWSEIDDPLETTNENPVGTGPFVFDEFSSQLYNFVKNEDYWSAEDIDVHEVQYPANTTETFNTALQSGELDWSGGFVPNIEEIFVQHDPENRDYWYPGGGLVNLLVNFDEVIFEDAILREALSLGMDRQQLSDVAMQGYTPPAHPTGLPLPAYETTLSDEYRDEQLDYDPDSANQILEEAGYVLGDDGIRVSPDGERLSWTVEVPSSWSDWVDIVQLLEEQYDEIGIEIIPQGVSYDSWLESRNNGNYDITLSSVSIGLTPFDMFRDTMSSEYQVDEGAVISNFGRYYSEDADAALERYANTNEESEQQAALDALQEIMVEELPTIPMLQSPNWYQYNTEHWEGFPNEDNPYALGAPFQTPDILLVVHNLTPTD